MNGSSDRVTVIFNALQLKNVHGITVTLHQSLPLLHCRFQLVLMFINLHFDERALNLTINPCLELFLSAIIDFATISGGCKPHTLHILAPLLKFHTRFFFRRRFVNLSFEHRRLLLRSTLDFIQLQLQFSTIPHHPSGILLSRLLLGTDLIRCLLQLLL